MKLVERIASRFGFQRVKPIASKRTYAAAAVNRLTEDWSTMLSSADTEVNGGAKKLRARARQMERDNPFVERYLKLLENNVLGATGIGLQMKVRDPDRYEGQKLVKGGYDVLANRTIENGWEDWGRKGVCCTDGVTSWVGLQKLCLRSAARDGSCYIVKHYGKNWNKYGFALQFLEADYLREDHNAVLGNGNTVKMGIEFSPDGRKVAYHFYNRHPYEFGLTANVGVRSVRIEAERVIHVFKPTRGGQTNGVPWLTSSMMTLRQLDGYWEAELVAARSAASKMGFYEKSVPDGYQGALDDQGNPTQEMQPGVIEDLPMGVTFKTHDPQHPVSAFGDFVKSVLRGASAGMGVSYNSLANDLEGVNYSSIRAGLLEERSEWMALQNWFIEMVVAPVFNEWLSVALLSGALKMPNGSALPAVKLDKFNAPEWKPRRWAWVDPLKDLNAKVLAIEKGLDSRRSAISEQGGDIEDVFADASADNELAKSYGLEFPTDKPMTGGVEMEDSEEDDAEDDAEDSDEMENESNGKPSKSKPLPPSDNVQAQALNGAQLDSIANVLNQVSTGALPKEAASVLIKLALPTADAKAIDAMLASAASHKPPAPPEPKPAIASP